MKKLFLTLNKTKAKNWKNCQKKMKKKRRLKKKPKKLQSQLEYKDK